MIRFHRLREEAEGQRRLVSFGGGITLSAGSSQSQSQSQSQGSNAGTGAEGRSPADACEISSDESDTNGNGNGHGDDDSRSGNGNDSCGDDGRDDYAGASPFEKRARAASGNGNSNASNGNSTARPRGATTGEGLTHKTPRMAATTPGQADKRGGRSQRGGKDLDSSNGRGTEIGMSGVAGKTPVGGKHVKVKRREPLSRSSLEAFERIVSGKDFCLDSPPSSPTRNCPASRKAAAAAAAAVEGGGAGVGGAGLGSEGGASGNKGVDEDSDDSCEIMFTRVSRPASSTCSSASRAKARNG